MSGADEKTSVGEGRGRSATARTGLRATAGTRCRGCEPLPCGPSGEQPLTTESIRRPPESGYAPRLGLFSATMLVVGGIIGAGIFLNPAIVAQRVGSAGATMATWGLGA